MQIQYKTILQKEQNFYGRVSANGEIVECLLMVW